MIKLSKSGNGYGFNQGDTNKEWLFDGMTEFIDYADQKGPHTEFKSNAYAKDNWYMDKDYAESLSFARKGWDTGRQSMLGIMDKLSTIGHAAKPYVAYDVVGDGGWDIGRVIDGIPECAMDWRDDELTHERMNGQGNIIKIIVDVTPSAVIDSKVIHARGAAILSLCELLEEAGKRTEIEAIWYCGSRNWQLTVPVKKAHESLQVDQIAFAIAHPAFARRFCHLIQGGSTPQSQEDLECDLYMPPMSAYENAFSSIQNALAWLSKQLKEFGVTLEGF